MVNGLRGDEGLASAAGVFRTISAVLIAFAFDWFAGDIWRVKEFCLCVCCVLGEEDVGYVSRPVGLRVAFRAGRGGIVCVCGIIRAL